MSLIVRKDPVPKPVQIDRLDLATCIEHVKQMIASDLATVRMRITRLYEEGLDSKTIISQLIERHHEKETEFVLGEVTTRRLELSDLTICEDRLGLNDLTDENKKSWLTKFTSGRARYLCPACGYAGNDEFTALKGCFAGWVSCYRCPHMAYSKYFTHAWSEEEKAAYETEQEKKSARYKEERAAAEQRDEVLANVRQEATLALEWIDRYRAIHIDGRADEDDGQFPYKFEREDHLDEIERIVRVMLSGLKHPIPMIVPSDEVIKFFIANLKPSDDLDSEFERVARLMEKMLTGGKQ